MRKTFSTFIAVGLGVAPSLFAATKPIKTDDLSNMIIKGQNRLSVSGVVPEVAWAPDVFRDFIPLLDDDSLVGSLKSPAIANPPVVYSATLASPKAGAPWLQTIHEAPVLTLKTKPTKDNHPVTWVLLIKDSKGVTFSEVRNKGILPETIAWDGFGKGGVPLSVGYDYTYSLSIIDEAGNTQRFAGKPFHIAAFRYRKGGESVICLEPAALFESDSSFRFSDAGKNKLVEVKDFLRPQYNRKVDIAVFGADEKFGLARANAIHHFIQASLDYPDGQISAHAQPIKIKDGTPHVEIHVK